MMAEMGAAYRKEEGGIYSWMNNSVGHAMLYWYFYVVLFLHHLDGKYSAKVWVPFSTFLFGSDMTQHWRFAGLEPTQVVGLLAVAWMIIVTTVASKGINKIARITAVGGIAVMCLNLVLLLVSIAILLLNGGHFAQDINFVTSPNRDTSLDWQCCLLSYLPYLLTAVLKLSVDWWIKRKTRKKLCQRYCVCRNCYFYRLFISNIPVGS